MKILITGADGMLGSNIVRELLKRNHDVKALVQKRRDPATLKDLDVDIVKGDILNKADVTDAMHGCNAVIHCAACTATWPSRSELVNRVNIDGTQNVVDVCLENDIQRLVHIGTANSFGYGSFDKPGTENSPYSAYKYKLDYMDSKAGAQNYVLNAVKDKGLNALVVNPTFMFGAYDSTPNAGTMILAIANNKVPATTVGGKNFVNASDVAVAVCNALKMGKAGECYILGNENLTFKSAFERIAKTVDGRIPKFTMPGFMVKVYGAMSQLIAQLAGKAPMVSYRTARISCDGHYYSSQKAVNELKMPQNSIENGIREFMDWYESTQKNK